MPTPPRRIGQDSLKSLDEIGRGDQVDGPTDQNRYAASTVASSAPSTNRPDEEPSHLPTEEPIEGKHPLRRFAGGVDRRRYQEIFEVAEHGGLRLGARA